MNDDQYESGQVVRGFIHHFPHEAAELFRAGMIAAESVPRREGDTDDHAFIHALLQAFDELLESNGIALPEGEL